MNKIYDEIFERRLEETFEQEEYKDICAVFGGEDEEFYKGVRFTLAYFKSKEEVDDQNENLDIERTTFLKRMRSGFDAIAKHQGLDISRSEHGCYKNPQTDLCFSYYSTAFQMQQDVINDLNGIKYK
ncbi:hypothetical protein [Acinetobacter junii]|uniref:hypothetical protein n=1 Tax=Acinetobacter junii TaxID=40215 RepID=UPI000F6F557B|nr:hypothetical protein [Acinetobacter junii]AZM38573.1 hypothetical protein EJP75_08445 [Acinetobacter baumannii]MBL8283271.1 hypothetical protein [Acinetobacter junii]MDH1005689.1 hypothetical protein [Acinetobacter junii]MDH1005760.1 hypothetical protein [Acinetobacter junii]